MQILQYKLYSAGSTFSEYAVWTRPYIATNIFNNKNKNIHVNDFKGYIIFHLHNSKNKMYT